MFFRKSEKIELKVGDLVDVKIEELDKYVLK
ncbi:MAG: hypothetical protein LBC61_04200 [Candidatus Peribacteria bacterium]|nr:hypothetical protein [Candidatus Peribacteria bacterium]